MGRPAVRRIEPHRARRNRDGAVIAGVAVVVLFALVGVVSAGVFLAGKVSGSPSSAASRGHQSTTSSLAARDVSRARAQATAIVAAAQAASQNIVHSATKDAKKRADSIVAAANKRARQIVSSAQASTPAQTPAQTATASGTSPTPPVSTGASALGTTGVSATGATGITGTTGATSPVTPNLSGLPASWLVVAYNPTFGSGPGTVGGITVINRGKTTFSGVARVKYAAGGSSRAFFTSLAPGQSVVLPLNGRQYAGGGYTIQIRHVH